MKIFLPHVVACFALTGCVVAPKVPPVQPYLLSTANTTAQRSTPGWIVIDRRPGDRRLSQQVDPGRLVLGDELIHPQPAEYVRKQLMRAIDAHPASEQIGARLNGKELSLIEFEVALGTRSASPPDPKKLLEHPPPHSSRAEVMIYSMLVRRWEVVRVRLVVRVDGQVFESSDVHPFNPDESPSPAALPAAAAVNLLVNQMQLFWRD